MRRSCRSIGELVGEGHRAGSTALPASTSSTAATTRAFSSASPFGQSIGRKRHSAREAAAFGFADLFAAVRHRALGRSAPAEQQTSRRETRNPAKSAVETASYGEFTWDRLISSSRSWAAPTAAAPARRWRRCRPNMRAEAQCAAATGAALIDEQQFRLPDAGRAVPRRSSSRVGRGATRTGRSRQAPPRLSAGTAPAAAVRKRMKNSQALEREGSARTPAGKPARTASTRRRPPSSNARTWAIAPKE